MSVATHSPLPDPARLAAPARQADGPESATRVCDPAASLQLFRSVDDGRSARIPQLTATVRYVVCLWATLAGAR